MGLLRRQLTSHLPLLAGRGRLWLALSVALMLLGLFAAGCSYFQPGRRSVCRAAPKLATGL